MTVKLVLRRAKEMAELVREERGQALVEYSLLLALIAFVAFGAVNFFGHGVSGLYSKVVADWP